MKILSLFDGMSCGNIAMINAGVKIDRYVAYEIDKYAIQATQHNFPYVEQMGDVFKADFTAYKGFDFLVGGSPCTYWSIAQSKNRETVASGIGWELFSQYVRALHEAQPKYFIYENNKSMSQAIKQSITETFGFEPVCINSALVSAQNRQRLYWVGIRCGDKYKKADVSQPEDRGILLKDILDGIVGIGRVPNYSTDKSRPLSVSYCHKGDGDDSVKSEAFPDNPCKQVFDYVAEPILTSANRKTGKSRTLTAGYTICSQRDLRVNIESDGFCGKQGVAEKYVSQKDKPIYLVKDGQITIKGKQYPIKLKDGYYIIRKLTVNECKRLQTVPDWYEFPISNSQAYKCLGNGWTCDVITHLILSALNNGAEQKYGQLTIEL